MYTLQIRDRDNTRLAEFTSYTQIKFGKRLNDYGSAEIQMPMNNTRFHELVSLRRNSIWIYRDNDLKWSGEFVLRDGELNDNGAAIIKVVAFDWLQKLKKRRTAETIRYEDTDAGQILKDLITRAQAETYGNMGITFGTIEETMPRDREYHSDSLYDVAVNLTNVINGFDMEIDNNKVMNIRRRIGVDRSQDLVFTYGSNIRKCRITEDYTEATNRAIVLGQAKDQTQLVRLDRNNTESQQSIGLLEDTLTDFDISEEQTFKDKGDAMNRKYAYPLISLDIELLSGTPNISQFSLGDLVRNKIEKGIYKFNDIYRIFEWEVTVDSNDRESLKVVMGRFTL